MDEKLYKHRRQQSSNAFSDVTIIVFFMVIFNKNDDMNRIVMYYDIINVQLIILIE